MNLNITDVAAKNTGAKSGRKGKKDLRKKVVLMKTTFSESFSKGNKDTG
ncbi:hypothetical protein [Arachidicoccus rhizosphaerae]|nr:hypothetical protein [Arachidicoccus rhizosphaerae]